MNNRSYSILRALLVVQLLVGICTELRSQMDSSRFVKAVSPVVGISQWNSTSIELGVSRNSLNGTIPSLYNKGITSWTHCLSAEIYITQPILLAAKYGIWYRTIYESGDHKWKTFFCRFSFGMNFVGYTDMTNFNSALRPEISFTHSFVREEFMYYDDKDSKKYKRKRWLYLRKYIFKIGYAYDFAIDDKIGVGMSPHRVFIRICQEGNKNRIKNTKPGHF